MSRSEHTWFGIKLTQKQATSLFVLSIVGILITFSIVLQMFMPLLLMYTDPYYNGDLRYFFQYLLMMAPYLILMIVGLLLSVYTLIKCRRIAKSHSELIFRNTSKSSIATFCSNCGNIRLEEEHFCKQCGQEFR